MTNSQIITDILDYVKRCGGNYSNWYAGIATSARQRLFTDHNVDEANDQWIFRQAESESDARNLEKHLLDLGFDGDTGGGDRPTYMYVYKKNTHTVE